MTEATILDLGISNTQSIANMLLHIGHEATIVADGQGLNNAERIIVPGVGSYDAGMRALAAAGATQALQDAAAQGTPILGICLGMQLLGIESEEGSLPGLGILPARFHRLPDQVDGVHQRVPHMGWNYVRPTEGHALWRGFDGLGRFYFVHSYACIDVDRHSIGATTYGIPFASVVQNANVVGVQFHPEKSHRDGMKLLRNFMEEPWNPA